MSSHYVRPAELLQRYSKAYPNAWKIVDLYRHYHAQSPDWPDWCFINQGYLEEVVYHEGGEDSMPHDAATLTALAAWRMTKGVYSFDETILDAVWETPVKGDIPTDIVFRIPEWCVYVATPGKSWGEGYPMHGFFARLQGHRNIRQLEILMDCETPVPLTIPLDRGSLVESLADLGQRLVDRGAKLPSGWHEDIRIHCSPIVSLVLYLCSQAAEIRDAKGTVRNPVNPKPKRTKRGERLFAAEQLSNWEVGYRMGAALRRAETQAADWDGEGSSGKKRPHVRRAHWHTYWVGPRDSPERKPILRWLLHKSINVEELDDLVTTVRPVL